MFPTQLVVCILKYVTEESNYTPQEKGTMDSQKRNLFRNTAHHIFTSNREEKYRRTIKD